MSVVVDGREAIERYLEADAAGVPYRAVIMDLTIPGGMGGAEAVQKLLKKAPDARVVVSSGYSEDTIMTDCQTYGFAHAIRKPYSLEELRACLVEVLKEPCDKDSSDTDRRAPTLPGPAQLH